MPPTTEAPALKSEKPDLQRILRNWREECDSAALYEALALIEVDSQLGRVFGKLAASEREQVLIGALAAALTYGVGRIFGAVVG
jgi:hypothetical protein